MSDDVVLRLYFVKEDIFPFRIKNPGFSILQSDVNVIQPGSWLLKINHKKTSWHGTDHQSPIFQKEGISNLKYIH